MELSENRKSALALVLAIVGAEMALSGKWGDVWRALWGPALGLGTGALAGGAKQTLPPGYHWEKVGSIWVPVQNQPGTQDQQPNIQQTPTTNGNGNGGSGNSGGGGTQVL